MSAISRDDVAHLAMLARIDLSNAELDKMSGELAIILQSVARVSEVATADVPPTSHPLPLKDQLLFKPRFRQKPCQLLRHRHSRQRRWHL